MLENLFPFGEHPANIEITYDGKLYSIRQRIKYSTTDHVEMSDASPQLDPRWKRFWGDREDATANMLENMLGVVAGVRVAGDKALTFEGDQPVISADFVETLNLGPDELVRVNQILLKLRHTKSGFLYGIDGNIGGGWWGPKGNFSKAEKQLPDKYRRLLPE